MRIARRYRFSASHRLHSTGLSDQANADLYGKCNNPYGHGHDYQFEVVLRGKPDEVTGLLVPLPQLDSLVRRVVLDEYDHKYLNAEVTSLQEVVPTTENVTRDIFQRLQQQWPANWLPAATLDLVRVWETRRNIVEVGRLSE